MSGNTHIPSRRHFSKRSLRTLSAFGLTVDDAALTDQRAMTARIALAAAHIDARLRRARIALLTGPSGSGKTSLLRELTRLARRPIIVEQPSQLPRDHTRAIDALGPTRSLAHAMRLLSAAGLADARLMVTPIAHMSEGERARLALARAMARAARARTTPITLIIDEFASSLDHITALSLAATLARWVRQPRSRLRAIIATNRDHTAAALAPDIHIDLPCTWACTGAPVQHLHRAA
jgi:ABC-type ATPase with predicted acetyltransferase domain